MTATTTTIRTRRHGMTAELAKAVEAARDEGLRVADASTPAPDVTHEPVPTEFERAFGIRSGRRIGKTVISTEMLRAALDPAGAEALAKAEAKRERKAAKRERNAQRQRPT